MDNISQNFLNSYTHNNVYPYRDALHNLSEKKITNTQMLMHWERQHLILTQAFQLISGLELNLLDFNISIAPRNVLYNINKQKETLTLRLSFRYFSIYPAKERCWDHAPHSA